MTSKDIIGKAVEVVAFALGAFSGYLTKIAPPDETGAAFAVGLVSFAALIIYLFILTLARGMLVPKHRKYWFAAAALCAISFISFAFVYRGARERLTFPWPPDESEQVRYVSGGDQYTPSAQRWREENPGAASTELVADFGGINKRTAVWPAEAISRAGQTLTIEYIVMVLSLLTAIFCLTEGLLLRDSPPALPATAPPASPSPPPAQAPAGGP